MRPVNLIPSEERHGRQAPLRSGPLLYILVGALALVLAGVAALVLTGNQVTDRKSEVAELQRQDAAEAARANRLAVYTQFRDLHEQRVATVTSLADSRFDWERVMRELALILPSDVWLTSLDATAGGSEGEGGSGLASSAAGPALELSGCAEGPEAVAGFVTALKDIDGVTRVGLQSSQVGGAEGGGEGGASSEVGDCSGGDFVASFQMTAVFDAAPIPAAAAEEAVPAPEASETTATESSEGG